MRHEQGAGVLTLKRSDCNRTHGGAQFFVDSMCVAEALRRHAVAILVCAFTIVFAVGAKAKTPVDLELVLAVDISLSMQLDEQQLQRQGYVTAFRDPALVKAIQSGPQGRIAVTYFEWAGSGIQSDVVSWRLVHDARSAREFADALAARPIRRARMTSVSGAIRYGLRLFGANKYSGLRRVIDVSGDGPNNSGRQVELARDQAAKQGVTVNGLPIMVQSLGPWGGYFEIPDLDKYYKDCVITGPAAFVIAVRSRQEFSTAVRQKLLLEIAGQSQGRPTRNASNAPLEDPVQARGQPRALAAQPRALAAQT